jgi:pantoate--beta-alanine ligase
MTLEISSLDTLRATVSVWKSAGQKVALVPTMGALHRGHIALVEAAKQQAERVLVSIFVNPTQFGPAEDFSHYPRPLADDLAALRSAGADGAWLPTQEIMYPHGFATTITVKGIPDVMDGVFRPGHFDGVATIVAKLLLQVTPDLAFFGEKDYQQLCLIKRLATDLNINTNILGVDAVRESDGLALSSRNAYLSADQRAIAPILHRELTVAAQLIGSGGDIDEVIEAAKATLMKAGFSKIDYVELREGENLSTLEKFCPPARLLAAAWLGTTRLIDNVKV